MGGESFTLRRFELGARELSRHHLGFLAPRWTRAWGGASLPGKRVSRKCVAQAPQALGPNQSKSSLGAASIALLTSAGMVTARIVPDAVFSMHTAVIEPRATSIRPLSLAIEKRVS